jgi:hypothetical protein
VDGTEDLGTVNLKKEKQRRRDPAEFKLKKCRKRNTTRLVSHIPGRIKSLCQAHKGEPAIHQLMGIFILHNSPLMCISAISETVKKEVL